MHPNEVDLKRSRLNNYSTEIVVNHKSFIFFLKFLALKWHKGCPVDQPLIFLKYCAYKLSVQLFKLAIKKDIEIAKLQVLILGLLQT